MPVGTDGDRQMMMVASPTSGFGSYGPVPAKRAARLFEFDIRHPYEPRTQLLEYDELVGKPSAGKAYAYGMTSESKPDSEGMDLLHRPTCGARRGTSWSRCFAGSCLLTSRSAGSLSGGDYSFSRLLALK